MTNNSKIEKVPSLEELNVLLSEYSKKIDYSYIRIIKDIINLEFSVLRKDILDSEEREQLSEIELYRKAAIYNIYHRAMEILNKEKNHYNIKIRNNEDDYEGIIVSGITPNEERFNIYNFKYTTPRPYIKLYRYLQSDIRRDKEIEKLLEGLEKLYFEENPFLNNPSASAIQKSNWEIDRERRIVNIEKLIKLYESRNIMPAKERKKADVQNYFASIFEQEYGIIPKKAYVEGKNQSYIYEKSNGMYSLLKKNYPSLSLTKEVKYY